MKHTKHIPLPLALVLMASVAFAQTTDGQAADSASAENAILAARSQYTETARASPPEADSTILAQLRRGGPARPFPPQRGYPRGTYQTPWRDHGNAGHILIGAAIGFGVGAALGANQSAHNGTPVAGGIVFGGGLFALLGGCVGKAVGDLQGLHYASVHRRRIYQPSWPEDRPEDDAQAELRSHSKAKELHSESAKPASPGRPVGVEALEP
jgi:hypothetical protein